MLAIAIVGRPVGVDGMVRVTSYSGEYDHLASLTDVELRRNESRTRHRIERVVVRSGDALVHFAGVTDPEAAKRFTGWEIWAERSFAAPLGTDEYYIADLVGCVVRVDGRRIGEVVAVVESGQAPLLEVRLEEVRRPLRLVPFMDRYVGTVAIESRTIDVRERWILDLD